MCELETLDGGGALFGDVADDVGDGVGLVAQVSVGNVDHAESAESLDLVVLKENGSPSRE